MEESMHGDWYKITLPRKSSVATEVTKDNNWNILVSKTVKNIVIFENLEDP